MFLRNVSGTFKVRLLPDVLKDDPVPLSVHWLLDTCVAEPDGGRQLSKRCSPTQAQQVASWMKQAAANPFFGGKKQ
jgi:hypothetical protein